MFEDAHPLEVLRWAGAEFGDGLVVTASFADAVLVHLVSRAIPDADVVLLDTGYLFAETEWYAEKLRRELGLSCASLHPAPDAVPDQWMTDTDACCHARKVEPLERALAGKTAWVTGLRRADSPTRATTPIVHTDLLRGVTKINPVAAWTDEDIGALRGDGTAAGAPARRPRLPVDRLLAVHPPGRRRRGPASGQVGRERQDRVRLASIDATRARGRRAAMSVEDVKRASRLLRGELPSELVDDTDASSTTARRCSSSTASTSRTTATSAGHVRRRSSRSTTRAWSGVGARRQASRPSSGWPSIGSPTSPTARCASRLARACSSTSCTRASCVSSCRDQRHPAHDAGGVR